MEQTIAPFEHGFTDKEIDINGIRGFGKCLSELYKYLAQKTEFNPEKRMIDAVDLLEKISATSDELTALYNKEQTRLNSIINAPLN